MVDGTCKTPTLRNVALTPPYFHYGGYKNLREVVEFYSRGGSRRDFGSENGPLGDDSGTGPLGQAPVLDDGTVDIDGDDLGRNVDGNIRSLNLTEDSIDQLVLFLKSFTDPAVQCDKAPFDHPQLFIFNGHYDHDFDGDGMADDKIFVLPEVGEYGYDPDSELCIPNEGDLFADGMGARVGEYYRNPE